MTNVRKMGLALAVTASMAVAAASAAFGADNRDVVVDKESKVIRSIVSKECVRTKWEASSDKCGSMQAVNNDARSYMIFFDFDRSNISGEAKGILSELVSKNGVENTHYSVTGHADRSGADAYNDKLSHRRAMSTQKALEELGVPSANIDVMWKGESSPLVATEDNIKEPQNRRAEISVSAQPK